MKRLVLLTIVVLCVSSLGAAQVIPGSIGVFADPPATNCNISDTAPGLLYLYIVHVSTNGSTASQWMLQPGAGFTPSYVAESSTFLTIGTALTGITVAYGSCRDARTTPILLLTMTYFGSGTSSACGLLSIVPDDDAPTGLVEVVDCAAQKHTIPRGGQARVNPDGTCTCNVAAEETSWGKIKSLYR